jgi:hypothetical protein
MKQDEQLVFNIPELEKGGCIITVLLLCALALLLVARPD